MKSRRVLVIDDDEWLADEYIRTLKAANFTVEWAGNAVDAIGVIDTFKPELIILDLFMPGPNGLVLLHELKSHTDLAQLPIVVITGAASDLNAELLQPYGVLQVINKATMYPGDVLAAVRRQLL